MSTSRGHLFVGVLVAVGLLSASVSLHAEDKWDETKRESAREAAEKAIAAWTASQPFKFKIRDEVYQHTKKPKYDGKFFSHFARHYERSDVLEIHPVDLDRTTGIEAAIKVPPGARSLRFVVSGHEDKRGDVDWDVAIDGEKVFSETIKTQGKWKVVRIPVEKYTGREVTLTLDVRATEWCYEFFYIDTIAFSGHLISVDSGRMKLTFEQFDSALVNIDLAGHRIGTLRCVLSQFEREGIGYKKTGVGWAEATSVKSIKMIETKPERCVVDVTAQRSESEETKRAFEATFRVTVYAGQDWFESQLMSVKNTDKVGYEIRAYSHRLCPSDPGARIVGYPECGGAVLARGFLGATVRRSDDFSIAFRPLDAGGYGDVTRKLSARVNPGFAWQPPGEPAAIIYVGEPGKPEALFQAASLAREATLSPKPEGKLKCFEEKDGAK